MIKQQRAAADNMTVSTERYSALVGKAEIFTSISERFSELLAAIEAQRHQLDESLKSLAQVLSAAAAGLPQLEKKILQLTEQMTFGVKLHQDEMTKALREAATSLQSAVSDSKKVMVDAIQSSNQEFRTHINDISAKTKEQVAALDVALERELTKAIETLARQLTALSQKFVEDYSPLTDRLRQLVSVSKGI